MNQLLFPQTVAKHHHCTAHESPLEHFPGRKAIHGDTLRPMTIDTLPEHIRQPHVRPLQPIPVQKDGQQFVALRDPTMLTNQTMVVPPQALQAIQHFRGERSVKEIAEILNGPAEQIAALAQGLDKVGLLWGPTFEELEKKKKAEIESLGAYPVGAAGSLGQDADSCRATLEKWLSETEDPELGSPVRGIVAPHLDYQRGWPNYAAAYRALDQVPTPDRVIILGTNHFGLGDGLVLSRFGFQTPLGLVRPDSPAITALIDKLGREAHIDELDHLGEHSIQLQLPWIQYRFGDVPIIAALVPDPLQPMIEDDGERITMEDFATALRETLDTLGGTSFIVASSDLSHVGPQFGEPRPVDEQRRTDVERHDREMMSKYCAADAEEFLGAMKWCNNPTRWCSVGNMTAALLLTRTEEVELIDYRQAYDERGLALVSSAAMALL